MDFNTAQIIRVVQVRLNVVCLLRVSNPPMHGMTRIGNHFYQCSSPATATYDADGFFFSVHGLLLKLIFSEQLQKYDRINKSVLKRIERSC